MLTSNKFDSIQSFASLSYCSSYYLFNAKIQPLPGFCLLFHLLFILARIQPPVLLTVPLVIYCMLETLPPGSSYCSICYLFLRQNPSPLDFAYCSTCYLFHARHHPPWFCGFAYCPTCYLFNARSPPPRFFLLFHLLFILRQNPPSALDFAYCSTCYLFYARIHHPPWILLTVPLVIYLMLETMQAPSPYPGGVKALAYSQIPLCDYSARDFFSAPLLHGNCSLRKTRGPITLTSPLFIHLDPRPSCP